MEIFRDVVGYEGLYQVSNEGRVKSLGNDKTRKEKLLKPAKNSRWGYLFVVLCKDGKAKHHFVHRLVASAFIPNPDNLPQVNHLDECKTNNNVENLEWCTAEYNHNYGTHNERVGETNSIPVDMLTKSGELIHTLPSSMDAERWLRVNGYPKASNTNITQCCKGNPNYTHAYGYKWRYAQKS